MGWRGWLPLGLLVFGFFAFASCPTVCVIIPETVVIERIPRPVPDPASETAVIKAFLSYGFHGVSQAQVKFLRVAEPELVEKARNEDLSVIRQLSERLAPDVLVLVRSLWQLHLSNRSQGLANPSVAEGWNTAKEKIVSP